MPAELRPFARHGAEEILELRLSSPLAQLSFLSWGCVLRDWRAAAPEGWRPVTLGFEDFALYPAHSPSFGALCGRVANRISGARFSLGGVEYRLTPNEGANLLHGGWGLGRRNWRVRLEEEGALFSYDSPEGEDGFPGAVRFETRIRLTGARLDFEMSARPDRPTPIALAQHSYWNLDGAGSGTVAGLEGGDVLDHRLRLDAPFWTEVDAEKIPTGRLRPVGEGAPDFRAGRALRDAQGRGVPVDLNYVLGEDRDPARPVAELLGGRGDLRLRLWTDQPGVQVYDAPGLSLSVPGLEGRRYGAFSGLCLEAQNFPDAVNRPEFPDAIFSPERPYSQKTSVEIAPV